MRPLVPKLQGHHLNTARQDLAIGAYGSDYPFNLSRFHGRLSLSASGWGLAWRARRSSEGGGSDRWFGGGGGGGGRSRRHTVRGGADPLGRCPRAHGYRDSRAADRIEYIEPKHLFMHPSGTWQMMWTAACGCQRRLRPLYRITVMPAFKAARVLPCLAAQHLWHAGRPREPSIPHKRNKK